MREHGRGLGSFEPPKPLLEAALLLAAFYALALVPAALDGGMGRISSPAFHLRLVAVDALRALLVLLVMARDEGLAAFGLRPIRWGDLPRSLLAASGAIAVLVLPSLLFYFLGLSNPLMAGLPRGTSRSLAPFFLASSLAAGYAEELCFRSYLMRRLEGAGLPPVWAALASSLLFGGAHGAQGLVGVASTTLVGLWLAWRWHDGRNIHEIAIGHGLYDAIVFALALYS
jgi:membrane protease YdiL (CAAX protease family)